MPALVKRPKTIDVLAPTIPTGLGAANVGSTSLRLTWIDAVDNVAVVAYVVQRDGVEVATVTDNLFDDTGLTESTIYSYTVAARDRAGNESAFSEVFAVQTADVTAPTAPTNVSAASITATGLTLNWDAPSDPTGVTGYSVTQDDVEIGTPAGTTLVVTGLAEYRQYTFRVAAHDASMNLSDYSDPLLVRTLDVTAPTVPTGLNASRTTANSLLLGWSPSTDVGSGVDHYSVKRDGVEIATPTGLSITDSGLIEHSTHTYTVSSIDVSGNASAYSSGLVVTTLDVTAPTVPTALAHQALTSSGVTITWTPSTDAVGVVSYVVRRNGVQVGTPTAATFTDTGLLEGVTYTYTVAARDASGNQSAFSSGHAITTLDVTPPTAPTNLVVSALAGSTLTLSWSVPVDNTGVVGYRVRRNGVVIANPSTATFNDSALAEFTDYTYEVAARDASNNLSAYSTPLTVKTLDVTAPATPPGLVASDVTGTTLTLEWADSSDGGSGVDHYQIVGAGFVTLGTTPFGDNSFDVTGLTQDTSYTFAVRAWDVAGNVSTSAIVVVQTADTLAPTVPTGLSVTNVTPFSLTLNWLASTDANGVSGYAVRRNGVLVALVNTTSFDDTGRSPSTAYSYSVAAFDAAGNVSATSTPFVGTTAPSVGGIPGAYPGGYAGGYGGRGDIVAPTQVSNLHTTAVASTSVALAWTAATDNVGVSLYEVYRSTTGFPVQIGSVMGTSYTDTTVSANTDYTYAVVAVDASGNRATASAGLDVTTPSDLIYILTPDQMLTASGTGKTLVPNNTAVDNTSAMQTVITTFVATTVPAGRRKTLVFNAANRYNCERPLAIRKAGGKDPNNLDIVDMRLSAITDEGHYEDTYTPGSEDYLNHIRTREHLGLDLGIDIKLIRYDVVGPFWSSTGINTDGTTKRRNQNSPQTRLEAQHALNIRGTQNLYIEDIVTKQVWGDHISINPGTKVTANDTYPGGIEVFGATAIRHGRMFITLFQVRAPDAIDPGNESQNPGPLDGSFQDAPSASGSQYGLKYHSNSTHPVLWQECERNEIDLEPYGVYRHINDVIIGADSFALQSTFRVRPGTMGTGRFITAANAFSLLNRFLYQNVLHDGPVSCFGQGSPVAPAGKGTKVASGSNGVALGGTVVIQTQTSAIDALVKSVSGDTRWAAHITGVNGTDTFAQIVARTATTITVSGGTGTLATGQDINYQTGAGRIKYTWQDFTVDGCTWNGVPIDDNFFQFTKVAGLTLTNLTALYAASRPHAPVLSDCPGAVQSGNSFTLG